MFIFSMILSLKAFSQPISLAYGRVIHRKFTLDIFQLMSFSIVLTDSVFFQLQFQLYFIFQLQL